MKRFQSRLLSSVLAAVLAISTVCAGPAPQVHAEETNSNYKIYPTPHEITYNGGEFTMTDEVNVVYSESIDSYTKAHVDDVLKILDKTSTISQEVVSDKTNFIVGVKGQEDAVNDYFADNALAADDTLFEKYDAYVLSVKDNVIAVLGKDTDAAFHGVTTLKHIFNQVENNTIKELEINDWADVKARGFIEGYYGNPWSNEDRADLMTFGGDYKLNSYFYAPKDDPKHNSNWKELYTEEELAEIHKLAEAGNRSKCYYVYALHTFMYNAVRFDTDAHYQEDLDAIKTKFEQLMGAGVKQFAILADDAAVPSQGPETYVRLMSDLTDWMKEKQATVEGLKSDMVFCPNDYMGWGTSAQMQALKALPDSVSIIQTGGKVWGEVGPSFNDPFYSSMGRPAYMWINWPCSDNTKWGLIMGGAEAVLKPGVDPAKVDGIVLNPMQQSEPSKEGIFTNADYAWNIWEEASEYNQVWIDSFNFMDHGTAEDTDASIALREISKHMKNSLQIGNEESEEIKDAMSQFITDYSAGRDVSVQADALIGEFAKLQKAAAAYKAEPGNPRTRDQMIYWLDCWQDTTEALINYLTAAKLIREDGDADAIWNAYSEGQAAFAKSKTHGFLYVNHTEYAKVGARYITPFMENLDALLGKDVITIVDPNKQVVTYVTNRADQSGADKSVIFDNNDKTEIVYTNPNSIAAGTYVGITYTKAININKVIFRLGANSNLNDTFSQAKIQYTKDGKEWTDLNDTIYTLPREVVLEELGLTSVKGIRMIATAEKSNTWLGVRDIIVNPVEESVPEADDMGTVTIDKLSLQSGSLANINDGNEGTLAHFAEGPYKPEGAEIKDYIPVDASVTLTFEKAKKLGIVKFVQDSGTDKIQHFAIEYSADGTTNWQKLGEYTEGNAAVEIDATENNITAKAVRVRNLELYLQSGNKSGWWWKLKEFTAAKAGQTAAAGTLEWTQRWTIYAGNAANLTDGNDATDIEFHPHGGAGNATLAGDYIGYNFGNPVKVGRVHAAIGGKRDAGNKWTNYSLQYSVNGTEWTTYKTYEGVASGKDIIDENLQGIEAQYIRFVNEKERNVWIIFSEFTVKEYDPVKDLVTENVYTNTDHVLSSVYSEALTKLESYQTMTLQPNEYVGIDLGRIKDLSAVDLGTTALNGLTLQVSKNAVEWTVISAADAADYDARYVRLINLTDAAAELTLDKFEVSSNEVTGPYFVSSTLGKTWETASENRNNGAAFDGDMDTKTKFGGPEPKEGDTILYHLGQERTIDKIAIYCQDSDVDYIRDAEILVSNDKEHWTKVVTIGDGVENTDDFNTKCIDSGIYKTSSTYPNKVYMDGTADHVKASYLKIVLTAPNQRGILFNEIVINDGEYAPLINDPTFTASGIEAQGFAPQNMFDGDLTTAYKPGSKKAGSLIYTLSEKLTVDKFNIMQTGISGAKVSVCVDGVNGRDWVKIGNLVKSMNTFYVTPWEYVYALKFEWEENKIPTIQEVILIEGEEFRPSLAVYAEVDAALEKAAVLVKDQYTVETWTELEAAMNAVERNLPSDEQNRVTDMAKAIEAAIKKLTLKPTKTEYVITVDGEEVVRGTYNTKAEITAPKVDGKEFTGWEFQGEIISTSPTYSFYIAGDMDFTAHYDEIKPEPGAMISGVQVIKQSAEANAKANLKFVAQLAVPSDYTIKETGLLWSAKDGTKLSVASDGTLAEGVKKTSVSKINNAYQFSVTINGVPADRFVRGVVYVKVANKTNGGEEIFYYSPEKKAFNK